MTSQKRSPRALPCELAPVDDAGDPDQALDELAEYFVRMAIERRGL